jgi:hypothetical protein
MVAENVGFLVGDNDGFAVGENVGFAVGERVGHFGFMGSPSPAVELLLPQFCRGAEVGSQALP